jgi:hypothetical protein
MIGHDVFSDDALVFPIHYTHNVSVRSITPPLLEIRDFVETYVVPDLNQLYIRFSLSFRDVEDLLAE